MNTKHPAPIELTVIPDLMGAEMLRLLADAIEETATSEPQASEPQAPAFKFRRSTFKVLPGRRS